MTDLWSYLKNCEKPIVLYGTGNGADKVIDRLNADGIKLSGIFASDGFKKGKNFRGFTVSSYSELDERYPEMVITICFGSSRIEVIDNIKRLMQKHTVFVADVPVYGDTVFDLTFARQNAEKIRAVHSLLSDELSKRVFENTILFKLTGNPNYLFEIETPRSEVFSLLDLKDNENFLDLGAYNGDTVIEFVQNVNSYSAITALEPDSRNYRKLCENTGALKNILCIKGAAGKFCGKATVSSQHGRGVNIGMGNIEIDTFTIDSLAQKNPPTLIKIDVEGAESNVLDGGKNTISALKPKMHIAVYHRSEDIFEIPLKIHTLCPDYKIFMRHHTYLPAWDTNIIVI